MKVLLLLYEKKKQNPNWTREQTDGIVSVENEVVVENQSQFIMQEKSKNGKVVKYSMQLNVTIVGTELDIVDYQMHFKQ
jgi:hypothetical protein